MQIRKSTIADLDEIMKIYDYARTYMSANGNANQWLDGYPKRELVISDISNGKSYVCYNDTIILGTFYFGIEAEPTYKCIYEGNWINDEKYGVIHRIATNGIQKGIAAQCINWCMAEVGNIRIDTHKQNIPMQKVIAKCEFIYCGIVFMQNGDERIAFQKLV